MFQQSLSLEKKNCVSRGEKLFLAVLVRGYDLNDASRAFAILSIPVVIETNDQIILVPCRTLQATKFYGIFKFPSGSMLMSRGNRELCTMAKTNRMSFFKIVLELTRKENFAAHYHYLSNLNFNLSLDATTKATREVPATNCTEKVPWCVINAAWSS